MIQYSDDFEKKEYNETRYPVRACREEDFGDTDYARRMFDTWKGYVLACPDLKNGTELWFMGDQSSLQSKYVGVKFERCSGDDCNDDIDDWLVDVQVDMWIIEDLIDQLKYEGRPTIQVQKKLNSHIFAEALVSGIIPVQNMAVVKNDFAMEDDWFQIGQITKEGYFYKIWQCVL